MNGEFPSGLVVRIFCVHCGGLDSIPVQKTEIPQDTKCGAGGDMINRILEC